jgi:hypothetical protein
MDFITELLVLEGYNAVLVVINQLRKERYYISYTAIEKSMTLKEIAKMLY